MLLAWWNIIHIRVVQNPSKFIQVIVALSSMHPSRLGWDETMKLRLRTRAELTFVHSTDPMVRILDYGGSAYDTQWAILFSTNEGKEEKEKWYVTVQALSVRRAEVMVGRATLVWLVKELKDDLSGVIQQVCPASMR